MSWRFNHVSSDGRPIPRVTSLANFLTAKFAPWASFARRENLSPSNVEFAFRLDLFLSLRIHIFRLRYVLLN